MPVGRRSRPPVVLRPGCRRTATHGTWPNNSSESRSWRPSAANSAKSSEASSRVRASALEAAQRERFGVMLQCDFGALTGLDPALHICIHFTQMPPRPGGDMVVREVARLGQDGRAVASSGKPNNELQSFGGLKDSRCRHRILIRGTTFHDSPRHAAALQLLAKRLLRAFAIPLHSKKILTIGSRNTSTVVRFLYRGALQCPKHRESRGVEPCKRASHAPLS